MVYVRYLECIFTFADSGVAFWLFTLVRLLFSPLNRHLS